MTSAALVAMGAAGSTLFIPSSVVIDCAPLISNSPKWHYVANCCSLMRLQRWCWRAMAAPINKLSLKERVLLKWVVDAWISSFDTRINCLSLSASSVFRPPRQLPLTKKFARATQKEHTNRRRQSAWINERGTVAHWEKKIDRIIFADTLVRNMLLN